MQTPSPSPIHTLLIANRGEIALRIARGAAKLGIPTVAVFSEADATSLHVRSSKRSYALGGNTAAQSYLDQEKILHAAKASGANAIHPGYGFLSENAAFAKAVSDAGLIWVGPPAASMEQLASKAAAKRLAKELGIPTLPAYYGEEQSLDCLMQEAKKLGAPLMLKAASGGGGRGMRQILDVHDDTALRASILSAQREALSGFADATLVLERALLAPRHVEVQIFADQWGNCIHLGERDCSVQRRHQKIIEEAPSPAVSPALRDQLGEWACRLASKAAYVGAGTVEFLLDGEGENARCYLMEMNTRLQVEHPVTEAITGLDLVEWQLRVAAGERLPLTQSEIKFQGHAIEVRLCAENDDFVPQTGSVLAVQWPDDHAGLRIDHALDAGAEVTPFYDSMLAKMIVHAPAREQACRQLAHALNDTVIAGIATNRQLLADCLSDPVFLQGKALIPFLAQRAPTLIQAMQKKRAALACRAAAMLAAQATAALPCSFERASRWSHDGRTIYLHLRPLRELSTHRARYRVSARQAESISEHEIGEIRLDQPSVMTMSWDGVHFTASTHRLARQPHNEIGVDHWHVHMDGADFWLEDRSMAAPEVKEDVHGPWTLRAPFNGKIVSIAAEAGENVSVGQVLLVIESMKLEHSVIARRAGKITNIAVSLGRQVGPGEILLQADPIEPIP